MSGIEINARAFHRRARALLTCWKEEEAEFLGASAIFILAGAADDAVYLKSSSLQQWFLGYAFPDSIMLIIPEKIVIVMSEKRAKYLEGVEQARGITDKVPIEILRRTKDEETNKAIFDKVVAYMTAATATNGGKVASLIKEKQTGKFVDEWNAYLKAKSHTLEFVDAASGISSALARKDDEDLKCIETASKMTSLLMKNYFVEEFQAIVNEGKKITHEKLCANTESCLTDSKKFQKLKFPKDVTLDFTDWCYPPIIQSGGKYDLKPSAQSDSNNLHDGTILCSLGVRYKNYCSNISRTFLVNPEEGKEKNYRFTLELQNYVISTLKDGVACRQVYDMAVQYIEKNRPDLAPFFVKSVGFGIGIEFKESSFTLGPKSTKSLKAGMVVNVSVGFQNLENVENKSTDERNKIYSLLLADTVKVPDSDEMPTVFTKFDRDFKDISYELDDEEEEEAPVKASNVKKEKDTHKDRIPKASSAVLQTKLRGEEMEDERTPEQKRALHQKQLAEKLQNEGMARFASGADSSKSLEKLTFRKFQCYRNENSLPKAVEELRVMVDRRNEAIILPIFGQPVPFHVSTLKSVAKNEEGDLSYLRFNFVTPGQAVGKKEAAQPFEDVNATFVRSMTYRSPELARFAELFREINDLKKEVQKREAERKEKADLVEQDKLIEVKGRRPQLLREVFVRPALEGKRLAGDLELHSNGLRYQSMLRSEQKIDILFSNIKHLFFQPCDKEVIIVLHIHLKHEIMIGRKKTKDVQFYREVSDVSFDETGNRRRRYNHGDEDEMLAEQEERQRRAQLNKEFKAYSEKIGEASKEVEVDIPFRDLAFKGVPFRQPVDLLPTTECLVHLIEPPFLIVTMSEVEIVHLERVRFGLKSFDMVVVFKEFTRPVQHINSIPMESLEHLKEWLDSMDICFTEGPVSLSWPQIMKTVNEDPAAFFEEGGWSCLMPDGDDSEESEDEESEYEMSQSSEESESEYNSDDSGSNYSGSGSGSGSDEMDDESADDWDEMERKAAKSDRKKEDKEVTRAPPSKKQKRRDDSDEDSEDERKKKKAKGKR